MRICYLHLGMPKTGSTSIQEAFRGFETSDLAMAGRNMANHGQMICCEFSESPQKLSFFWQRNLRGKQREAAITHQRALLKKALAGRKSLIFSSEGLTDKLNSREIGAMFRGLGEHFDKIVPIIYVRPAASLAASQFQQRVKTGLGEFRLPPPDYRARFEPVLQSAEDGATVFVKFTRDSLVRGDAVSDFAHRVGLATAPAAPAQENESLSAEAVASLYAFNKYTGPIYSPFRFRKMRLRLIKRLSSIGTLKFGFAPDLIKQQMTDLADEIAWAERATGLDLSAPPEPAAHPIGSEDDLLALAEDMVRERIRGAGGGVPRSPNQKAHHQKRLPSP